MDQRGLWTPGLKLDCGKEAHEAADSAAEANEQLPLTDCCARRKVANQPDFLEQREWLREVVENKGHQILYFPKFHCELNYRRAFFLSGLILYFSVQHNAMRF